MKNIKDERFLIILLSTTIGLLTSWDLFVDAGNGTSINHIFLEGSIILASFVISISLFLIIFKTQRFEILKLQTENTKLKTEHQNYRNQSQALLAGISTLIDKQFNEWQLTASEKEIALFLLKGLSHKEIAEIRKTAEKTIRQQASQVYVKSNLEGRAQLSAFFLEDLLLPNEENF